MDVAQSLRRTTLYALLAGTLVWAACGPPEEGTSEDDAGVSADTTGGPDAGTPDDSGSNEVDGGGTGEGDGMVADGGSTGNDGDGGTEKKLALVTATTNFMEETTTVSTALDDGSWSLADQKTYQSGDLVLGKSDERVYVINRRCSLTPDSCDFDFGEVQKLGLGSDGALSVATSYELPNGVYNPKGVGTGGDVEQTFATSYMTSSFYGFDDAGKPDSQFDLSAFDIDATQDDDVPEATQIEVEGQYVYVLLQRLSNFSRKENSVLVGYDTGDEAFVDFDAEAVGTQALDLGGKNAFGGLDRTPSGGWTVGLTGEFSTKNDDGDKVPVLDGKIVALEEKSGGKLAVGETLVEEEALEGNLSGYRMLSDTEGVAAVLKGRKTSVVRFDASSSPASVSTMVESGGTICTSPDHSQVWVGQRGASGSKFVGYDATSGEAIDGASVEVSNSPMSCRVVWTQ